MSEVSQVRSALFGKIGQERRLLKMDTSLGSDILLPQRVYGVDRISEGFDYTVDLLSLDANIELKQVIAQEVTLWVLQTDATYLPVHGYVHTAKKLGSDGQLTAYQIQFSGCTHFLKFRKDARIWQDKNAEDIIADVLNGHPQCQGRFRFELTQPARPRSYCTQYETDWHFVMRLMESEGWYAYFEQAPDGSGHQWIITDSVGNLKSRQPEDIAFHGAGTNDEVDKIVQWGTTRTLLNSQLSTKTFDYKAPRNIGETGMQVLPDHGSIPAQLEVYEYTGAYTNSGVEHGTDQSRVRVQEWESRAKRFFGTSGVRYLPVGRRFTLTHHPAHDEVADEARQFVVLNVEWAIENNLPLSRTQKAFSGSLKGQLRKFAADAGLSSFDDEALALRTAAPVTASTVSRCNAAPWNTAARSPTPSRRCMRRRRLWSGPPTKKSIPIT